METIPPAFQPPDATAGILRWRVYTPPPAPVSPPGVIVIHGGGWKAGGPFQDGPDLISNDLAEAGYYVVSVNYELAPCGLIPKQPCHQTHDPDDEHDDGYWVQRQSHEIKSFVKALRADTHVNRDKIGVVGGSAGATLAINVALDTRPGGWTNWTAVDRPVCAVGLSGVYDFSDRTPQCYAPLDDFINAAENYTRTGNLELQKQYSSVSLVTTPTEQMPFRPLFLINSEFDHPTPYRQIVDMICALKAAQVPDDAYQTLTIPNSTRHGFLLWVKVDEVRDQTVAEEVIEFLDAHLK